MARQFASIETHVAFDVDRSPCTRLHEAITSVAAMREGVRSLECALGRRIEDRRSRSLASASRTQFKVDAEQAAVRRAAIAIARAFV
jgi:hypothetical protein